MNGTYTATLDRVVDGQTAVILLEDDEEVVEQLDVSVEQLPDDAQREGSVLTIEVVDSNIISIQYDPDDTQQRREAAQERLDRLSNRLSNKD